MYTGYFAKLKTYVNEGLIPVSICGKAPDWYNGFQYKKLAPKYNFFIEWKSGSHKGDNEYYIEHFNNEVLDTLNKIEVIEDLKKFSSDIDKIVLLCYEKPNDFCHRHLVSNWLHDVIDINEYNK